MSKVLKRTRVFRFDEMAVLVKDKIDNPAEADVDRYVGLEHLDPESLRIRRWGEITDVESSKLVFRAGDIIFGKRRAYQRKLAVADFDGICSAHAMVLRARTDVVLGEFLPFFMQSDVFMERAVKISVGGLSPTINWSALAKEEFALPSLEEQRRIVEALQAAERNIESLASLKSASARLRYSALDSIIVGHSSQSDSRIEEAKLPKGWSLVVASELAIAPITSGITPRNCKENANSSCPFIKVGDLTFDGRLNYGPDGAKINRTAFEETITLHVKPGDILTNIVGPPLGKVSVVPNGIPAALINQAIVRFRMPNPQLRIWLTAYLMSSWAKLWLFVRSKKTSGQRNINATTCATLP